MQLISSVLNLGTFDIPLSEFRKNGKPLSTEEARRALSQRYSLLERIYLGYIKSFTHNHEFRKTESSEAALLRIAPSIWLKKFLFIAAGSILVVAILALIFGERDRESTRLLVQVIATIPMVSFGIPTFLGGLYFQFCLGKLQSYATDA
jgi:hypothetical protein